MTKLSEAKVGNKVKMSDFGYGTIVEIEENPVNVNGDLLHHGKLLKVVADGQRENHVDPGEEFLIYDDDHNTRLL